jgi:cytochrome P450
MRQHSIIRLTSNVRLTRTETLAAVLHVFAHAMVLHPEVQVKAREELDRVCGNRSPTFEDDLPYMKCVIKELLRWRTVEPTRFPHTNGWEDEFSKSRIVFPRHEQHALGFPEWDTFNLDWYANDKSTMTEGHYTFGWGRRDCPGMHLAAQLLFVVVAHLLADYEFGKARDPKTGEEIPVPFYDYTGNAIGR